MTEQMTGRTGPAGTERPAGAAAGPPGPSPRDLAARSPHHPAARPADQPNPAPSPAGTAPLPAAPAVPAPDAGTAPSEPHAHVTSPGKIRATGAQALVYALERVGADVVFGIPGGAVLPAYDPLLDSKAIRHILVRHEQGAGHAATGYAQATGRIGVCMATSGPGATNLVTPIADAYMDSVPIVAITGQVPTSLIGTDGFQEADISGITIPITKHNFLVTKPEDIARTIGEAFHVAGTGRPGPVLVDIAKDAMQATTDFVWPVPFDLPGYHPVTRPHARQVREAARLISESRRPVLYVGGGVIKARAATQLRELAELTGIPVVTTLMARGAFPDRHPQHMGMPGMHGTVAAVGALQKADLIIALVNYYLKERPGEKEFVTVEILEGDKVIRTYTSEKKEREEGAGPAGGEAEFGGPQEDRPIEPKAGVNRLVWDMRILRPSLLPRAIIWGNSQGPRVAPGTYTVRVKFSGETKTETFEVRPNPNAGATAEDLKRQFQVLRDARDGLSACHDAVAQIRDVKNQAKEIGDRAEKLGKGKALKEKAKALSDKLTAIEKKLVNPDIKSNQDVLNFTPALDHQFAGIASVAASADAKPTDATPVYLKNVQGQLSAVQAELKAAFDKDLAEFNQEVRKQDIPPVVVVTKKKEGA